MPTKEQVKAEAWAWFNRSIACNAIAQHTPAYNQARAAIDVLVERLEGLFDPAPAPKPVAPAPVAADPKPETAPVVAASNKE